MAKKKKRTPVLRRTTVRKEGFKVKEAESPLGALGKKVQKKTGEAITKAVVKQEKAARKRRKVKRAAEKLAKKAVKVVKAKRSAKKAPQVGPPKTLLTKVKPAAKKKKKS